MSDNVPYLNRIFALQENVISRYIEQYPERYAFVSQCIDALVNIDINEQKWKTIPVVHRTVFNYFHGDAVSTLVNAIRLCLQGCETDAFALMRVVIENLSIFEYIIDFSLYNEFYSELFERASKGKGFSKRFSYKNVVKELKVKDRRKKLQGHLSTLGSHISPPRLAQSRFRINNTDHVKVGMALNNPRVKVALGELASLALFTVIVTDQFLISATGDTPIKFHVRRQELEKEYASLSSQNE